MFHALEAAFADLIEGGKLAPLWWRLGLTQTITRFRRTLLGPMWLAGGSLATAIAIAFIFGGLFGANWRETFPYIIAGLIGWFLISGMINEAATAFLAGAGMMQVQRLPLSFHVYLHMHRTLINFIFQLIGLEGVLIAVGLANVPHWSLIPGLLLLLVTGLFMTIPVALLATRFRDVGHMLAFVMSLLFFLTPVFWRMDQMSENRRALIELNPFWHLLELVRQPLLGAAPAGVHWTASITVLVFTVATALVSLAAFRKRVIFWL